MRLIYILNKDSPLSLKIRLFDGRLKLSGYNTYRKFQHIEAVANALGFRIGNSKFGWSSDSSDRVALFPKDDAALPVYSRDAELFAGSFFELEQFLLGWEKAQQYDMLLRISNSDKRQQAEAKELERQRLEKERMEKKKVFDILSNQA